MKKEALNELFRIMKNDSKVYAIFIGLGWPRTDEFFEKFPDRTINTEASEQTALDIAVGLAYGGKIPFIYTITPFYLRAFETIRTYLNHENLNIKMLGAGRDDDYSKDDGYSHDAKDIKKILDTQENIIQYYPKDNEEMIQDLTFMLLHQGPCFMSVIRK